MVRACRNICSTWLALMLISEKKHADLVERLKAQLARLRTQYRFTAFD